MLVINCGTSSVKMSLFSSDKKEITRIADKKISQPFSSYKNAIETLLTQLPQTSLRAVGHRIVHGGSKYVCSTFITSEIKKELHALSELAPLHNPPALEGLEYTSSRFPDLPQIAVFDTAFHATLPPQAAWYPLPWKLTQKYGIKRYGFHGIAHAFSSKKYATTFQQDHKIITIHLGSGCSLTAIDNGVSLDTTMGFTPLDGIMMSTRCGELDPSILEFLCEKEKISVQEVLNILNHQSGLLGVSEKTGDMQEILQSNLPQAKLALEMYLYRIIKKIGAFITILGGVDALIFSGGVGEGAPIIRSRLIKALSFYPLILDEKKNDSITQMESGNLECIHASDSTINICIVGSDENLSIAEEMLSLGV